MNNVDGNVYILMGKKLFKSLFSSFTLGYIQEILILTTLC